MSLTAKVEEIKKILEPYFITDLNDILKVGYQPKYIDVFVIRKVIGKVIFRNTDRAELTYTIIKHNRLHVEVYSRKFKSMEKITGLRLLKKFNLLPEGYLYNALSKRKHLKNPVSVLYGDSVTKTEKEAAALPSRIFYTWGLSIETYQHVAKEITHNALQELGTMWDIKEKEHAETLFKNIYMERGHILQLVTFFNVLPEEFIFGLGNILYTHTYGAEDAVNQRNIQNSILLITVSQMEHPVTPYTVIENLTDEEIRKIEKTGDLSIVKNKVKNLLSQYKYVKILNDNEIQSIIKVVREIFEDENLLKELLTNLKKKSEEFVNNLIGA